MLQLTKSIKNIVLFSKFNFKPRNEGIFTMYWNDFNQEKKENELLGQILRNWFWFKFMKLTNEQVCLVHCFFHLGFWFWTIDSNCSSFLSQFHTFLLEDSLGECVPQDKGQTKAYHSSDDDHVPPLPQVDLLHEVVHQRKPGNKIWSHGLSS